jgi:hypothetical protein
VFDQGRHRGGQPRERPVAGLLGPLVHLLSSSPVDGGAHDLPGHVAQLAVLPLRRSHQELEGFGLFAALRGREHALGLLDHRARLHRVPEVQAQLVGVPVGVRVGQHDRRLSREPARNCFLFVVEREFGQRVQVQRADSTLCHVQRQRKRGAHAVLGGRPPERRPRPFRQRRPDPHDPAGPERLHAGAVAGVVLSLIDVQCRVVGEHRGPGPALDHHLHADQPG